MSLRLRTPVRSSPRPIGLGSREVDLVERSPLREVIADTNIPLPSSGRASKRGARQRNRVKAEEPRCALGLENVDALQVEQYKDTIRSLRKQIHSMACQMEARSRHVVERITASKEPEDSGVIELEADIAVLKETVAEKSNLVGELEAEKRTLLRQVALLRDIEKGKLSAEHRVQEIEVSNREYLSTIERLTKELTGTRQALEDEKCARAEALQRQQDRLLKEREHLVQERLKDQNQYEEQLELLSEQLQAQSKACENDIASAKARSEETIAFQRKQFEAAVEALQTELQALRLEKGTLDETLSQGEAQREKLSGDLDAEKQKSVEANQEILALKDLLETQASTLQQQIDALKSEADVNKQQLANLHINYERKESQTLLDHESQVRELKKQLGKTETKLVESLQAAQEARKQAHRLKDEAHTAKSELHRLKDLYSKQISELDALRSVVENQDIKGLKAALESSKNKHEADLEDLALLRAELDSAHQRNKELEESIAAELRTKRTLAEHNKELEMEHTEMLANKQKFTELKNDIKAMRTRLLDGTFERETRQLYETEIIHYQADIKHLKEHIQQLESSKKQYRKLLQAYTAQPSQEHELLQSYAQTIHQLTVELESYEANRRPG